MKAVILGWKRVHLKKYLDDCEKICSQLTKDGYDIYTGGGTGFMEYANKGAAKVDKNKSFGIGVECLNDKNININNDNFLITKNFGERKKKLFCDYDLIVFFPGGMGTLDEFSEVMNLLKTNEMEFKNVILYGYKYWNSLISWFEFNKIEFPMKYISGIADSVIEFNNILYPNNLDIKNDNESEDTNEDIKSYEPIFTKKNIFNSFDDIDNLIKIIFDNPNILEDLDYKTDTENNFKSIPDEYKMDDDSYSNEENEDDENSDIDEDIIIEIVYESSESSNKSTSDEQVKDINPVDFISKNDSSSDDE